MSADWSTAIPYLPLHPAEWSLDRWLTTYKSPTALGDWFVALHEVVQMNWDNYPAMAQFGLDRKERAIEMFKRWRDGTDKQIYLEYQSKQQANLTFASFAPMTNTKAMVSPPESRFPPALCNFNDATTAVDVAGTQANTETFKFGSESCSGALPPEDAEIEENREKGNLQPLPRKKKNKKNKNKQGAANLKAMMPVLSKSQYTEGNRKPVTTDDSVGNDIPETKKQKSSNVSSKNINVRMTIQKGNEIISHNFYLPKREPVPEMALPSTKNVVAFAQTKDTEPSTQSPGWTKVQSKRKRGGGGESEGQVHNGILNRAGAARRTEVQNRYGVLDNLEGERAPATVKFGAQTRNTLVTVKSEGGSKSESKDGSVDSKDALTGVIVSERGLAGTALGEDTQKAKPGKVTFNVTFADTASKHLPVPAESTVKKEISDKENPFISSSDNAATKRRPALVDVNTKTQPSTTRNPHSLPPTGSSQTKPSKYVPPQLRHHQLTSKEETHPPSPSNKQALDDPSTPLPDRNRPPLIDPIGTPCNAQSEDRAAVLKAQSEDHCGVRCSIGEKLKKNKIDIIMDRIGVASDTFIDRYLMGRGDGDGVRGGRGGDLLAKLHFIRAHYRSLPEFKSLSWRIRQKYGVFVGNGVSIRNVVAHDSKDLKKGGWTTDARCLMMSARGCGFVVALAGLAGSGDGVVELKQESGRRVENEFVAFVKRAGVGAQRSVGGELVEMVGKGCKRDVNATGDTVSGLWMFDREVVAKFIWRELEYAVGDLRSLLRGTSHTFGLRAWDVEEMKGRELMEFVIKVEEIQFKRLGSFGGSTGIARHELPIQRVFELRPGFVVGSLVENLLFWDEQVWKWRSGKEGDGWVDVLDVVLALGSSIEVSEACGVGVQGLREAFRKLEAITVVAARDLI